MGKFKYSDAEMEINKVLKMNRNESRSLLKNPELTMSRAVADKNITSSIELLNTLGKSTDANNLSSQIISQQGHNKITTRPVLEKWEDVSAQANEYYPEPIILENFMSEYEINQAFAEADEINQKFSQTTNILNKIDLSFLTVATALQVAKSLIFPYIGQKLNYGENFDPSNRLIHNDPTIETTHRLANDKFRDEHLKKHGAGRWINILYQTPPYDITKGSKNLGISMDGQYHRMYRPYFRMDFWYSKYFNRCHYS